MTRALLLALLASPALGQTAPSHPRADIEGAAAELGQSVIFEGLTRGGELLEVWADREGGEWTVTTTSAAMVTCVHSGRGAWEGVKVEGGVEG